MIADCEAPYPMEEETQRDFVNTHATNDAKIYRHVVRACKAVPYANAVIHRSPSECATGDVQTKRIQSLWSMRGGLALSQRLGSHV